jgi:peroxiredoxin
MIDDRLLRAFVAFGAPAEPDATFADRLFEDLAAELGFRRDVVPAGSLRGRMLRALGIERLPVGSPALRLAYLAAMLGLMLMLLAATLLIASRLLVPRPSPLELVQRSQGAYAEAPVLRMTIHAPSVDAVLTSDGKGTWRSETSGEWGGPPGSYALYDGSRIGWYDATVRTWSVVPFEDGGPPYPFNSEFTWTKLDYPGLKATRSTVPCGDATSLGEAIVAGRTADHVGCPQIGMEYWLDRDTHLVLRTQADPQSPFWNGPVNHDSVIEVTAFELPATTSAADFDWAGPAGASGPDSPLASTTLLVGERPPAWQGRTIDGRAIKSDELKTPIAVLLFDPASPRSAEAFDDFAAVAPGIDGLTPIIVGYDSPAGSGFVDGFVTLHPTDIPVVNDQGSIFEGWGITGWPALVLLGPDGNVSGSLRARITREDLGRVLAAAAAGHPIPSVEPAPAATPVAGDPSLDPSVVCSEDLGTCLPIGARMPEWSAPRMQGGTYGSVDLAGRPAVLVFASARCDPCPDWFLDELREVAALADEYRGRASVVIVSDGENKAGDTQAAFNDAGVDIPLVFDWDGALAERFKLIVGSALVFDGGGRYVDHVGFPGIADSRAILDALLASPSPGASP